MAQINRFEDIEAWKKARELAKGVYQATNRRAFSQDYGLRDQIRGASVSVVSNIAESFPRQTDREFIQFLYMAKGSVSEVQSQLYIASDLGYLGKVELSKLYHDADEVAKLIPGHTLFERRFRLLTRDSRLMTVLVTGGAGFIGSHLCDWLLNGRSAGGVKRG